MIYPHFSHHTFSFHWYMPLLSWWLRSLKVMARRDNESPGILKQILLSIVLVHDILSINALHIFFCDCDIAHIKIPVRIVSNNCTSKSTSNCGQNHEFNHFCKPYFIIKIHLAVLIRTTSSLAYHFRPPASQSSIKEGKDEDKRSLQQFPFSQWMKPPEIVYTQRRWKMYG